jgi:hypothetical protein
MFGLLIVGGTFVGLAHNYARGKCLLVGSESVCNTLAAMLEALLIFFVGYLVLRRLKEIWPSEAKTSDE